MFAHWEVYDLNKKYVKPDGSEYTNELFVKDYPATSYTKMAVYVYENTIVKVSTVDYIRGINRISYEYNDETAMAMVSNIEQKAETESTPEERIAAALEFIELLNMGGPYEF